MNPTDAGIGSRLQRAREQRELTLHDLAGTTKIPVRLLQAIEQDAFDRLPGGIFRPAYIRTFAEEVGLDADDLIREYRGRFETASSAAALPPERAGRPRPFGRDRIARATVLCVGIVLGLLLIAKPAQVVPVTEDNDTDDTAALVGADDGRPATGLRETAGVAFTGSRDAGNRAMPLQLELTIQGPCWVSAVTDGARRIDRLMLPGERALIEANEVITVHVGDAGAAVYSMNGTTVVPFGRSGQAVTLRISIDDLGGVRIQPVSDAPHDGASRGPERPAPVPILTTAAGRAG